MARPPSPADPTESRTARGGAPADAGETVRRIGKYEIQKKIGAGGMGAVYLATDTTLRRAVALKVLPQEKAANPTLVKRFRQEAQAAAQLKHENIVSVYETGEADGYSYIALEYVEGTDAANLVAKRGPIPVKRSVEIIRQIAKALQHAHEHQTVHRDIKPANLLVRRDGLVKLADLGLARIVDDTLDTSITRAGTTVGTVDYMSPEQAQNSKAADVRSDMYSLGCTWYFMLTGEPPFPEGSMTDKLRLHGTRPIPDPRDKNPSIPEGLSAVMRRMTEKVPAKRYQSPAELLADLNDAVLADNAVSEQILSDLSDASPPLVKTGGAKRALPPAEVDEDDARPSSRKRRAIAAAVVEPDSAMPDRSKKPPREDRRGPGFELNRVVMFYAVVAVLIVGIFGSIAWVVSKYGEAVDSGGRDLKGDNPFAKGAAGSGGSSTTTSGGGKVGPGESLNPKKGEKTGPEIVRVGTPGAEQTSNKVGNPSTGGEPKKNGLDAIASGTGKTLISPDLPAEVVAAREKRIQHENSLLPAWATKARAFGDLQVLIVGSEEQGERRYATLGEALERVPAEGAVILLQGRGPFPLEPARIADKTRVVIIGEPGTRPQDRPLVVLMPLREAAPVGILDVSNTALDLRNLHIGFDGAGLASVPDGALIHVDAGDLFLENCSLSVRGIPSEPLTGIRLSGKSAREAKEGKQTRVLFENTVVRGNSLTGLLLDLEQADVVLRQSLVWGGAAPAVRVAGGARSESDAARDVRFVSSTVCSSRAAIELSGDPLQPVPTTFQIVNSLLAAPVASEAPALFALRGWKPAQQQSALGRLIHWKAEGSLFTGWKSLLRLEPDGTSVATDPSQWQSAWKNKLSSEKEQVQSAPWPVEATPDVAAVRLELLAPESVGKQYVKSSEGGWPGCPIDAISLTSLTALDVVQAQSQRPQLPQGFYDFPAVETIRIDLSKESDLGKALASRRLQTGTEVIASGAGPHLSSPIVIQNAWVRLRFEQTEGTPLVISPRMTDTGKIVLGGPQRGEGFIYVSRGGLEIIGGAFSVPASDQKTPPPWFMQVVDGDIAMYQCRMQTPLVGLARTKGLIQWRRTDGQAPQRPFQAPLTGYAAFENCYLAGSGPILEAELRQRALLVQNCVAVSRDDLFAIDLRGTDSQIAGAIDLESSTFSAAGAFFKIQSADLGAPTESPLEIYADRCVFAPPLRADKQKSPSTLVASIGPLMEQRQLAWWENRCGYAPDIAAWIRPASETVIAQDFGQVWLAAWGADRVFDPLTGTRGVVLKSDLPQKSDERARLEPDDFALHSGCQAVGWDSGRPIGARLASMNVPPLRGEAAAATPKKTPPKSKTPKPAKTPSAGF